MVAQLSCWAVVGSEADRPVIPGQNYRRRAVVVNVGIDCITDPQQIGGYGQRNLLALVDERNFLASGDVDRTVDTVHHIKRTNRRLDKDFRILASDDP